MNKLSKSDIGIPFLHTLCALSILLLGACAQPQESYKPIQVDPESLISKEEMSGIFGYSFEDGPDVAWMDEQKLAFSFGFFSSDPMISVSGLVRSLGRDPEVEYQKTLKAYANEFGKNHRVEPVSGIGEAAFYDPQLAQIVVFLPGHYLNVSVMSTEKFDTRKRVRDVAEVIIPRLQ